MKDEKQSKIRMIIAVFVLVVTIALAIISTCILNSKKNELDDLNNKNDQIENTLDIKINFEEML